MTPTEFEDELDDISADSECLKGAIIVLQNTAYSLPRNFDLLLCVIRDFADNLSNHCAKARCAFDKVIENLHAELPESEKKGEPHAKRNGEN